MAATIVGFVVWRIIGGVAIGMASNLSPVYIAEIAPAAVRERSVALNQLTIVIGIACNLERKGRFVLVFCLAALGWYAMSLAPITWVVISEIFPNRIRGAAISVAVSAVWVACFVLTFTFPLLKQGIGMANTFWVYAAIRAVGLVFVQALVPETKGKSLEQIEKEWVD